MCFPNEGRKYATDLFLDSRVPVWSTILPSAIGEVGMVLPGDDVEDASVEGVVSPSTVLGAVDAFDIDAPDVPCVNVVSVAVIVVDVPNVVALAGANVDVIEAAVVLFSISKSVVLKKREIPVLYKEGLIKNYLHN